MKKSKRKTKADSLREIYSQIIKTDIEIKKQGGYKKIDFTEKDISYQELKTMYEKRVNKCRALEAELHKIKERSQHTKLKEGSLKLELYKNIIRKIVLEGNEKNEEDIFYEVGSGEKSYNEKKFSKKFKTWRMRNPELYNKIFYDICYDEFINGNFKSSELPFISITTTEK